MRTVAPARRSGSQASRMEVEPPVICAPIIAFVYTAATGACSMLRLATGTCSSSATSIASEVCTSWPISLR